MRLLSASSLSVRSFYGYLLASFAFLYFLLILYCRTHFYRDPTSAFFDPDRGYEQGYSRFRISQATNLIRHVDETAKPSNKNENGTSSSPPPTTTNGRNNASLCVGIASVSRKEVNYLESAVGSLLVDLSPQERRDIHLILFIAHSDPARHPSYSSNWLSAMADEVLLYDLPEKQMRYIKKLEKDGLMEEKSRFDYTYLLKACEAMGTSYTVMIEDDVIAMDGWYHRTRQALEEAEKQTQKMGASKYLYLRLFYTHKFLGWNQEHWFTYLIFSLLAILAVCGSLTLTRRYLPIPQAQATRFLSNPIIFILSFIITPLFIILFFAAGPASMLPIPPGVHQMPRYGCCSQAFAFPRARVRDIVQWYEGNKEGYADTLLEKYADENKEVRWAVTPSLFQHVGVSSSKFDKKGRRRKARSIWNFAFEEYDPVELQVEHERVVRGSSALGNGKGGVHDMT